MQLDQRSGDAKDQRRLDREMFPIIRLFAPNDLGLEELHNDELELLVV